MSDAALAAIMCFILFPLILLIFITADDDPAKGATVTFDDLLISGLDKVLTDDFIG